MAGILVDKLIVPHNGTEHALQNVLIKDISHYRLAIINYSHHHFKHKFFHSLRELSILRIKDQLRRYI